MSNQITCYSCGTVFNSNYYTGKCSTCLQTDRITEQNDRRSRDQQANFEAQRLADQQAQWRQDRIHEEQMEQNRAIAALQALNAQMTASAIERQTQAIFETSIRQEDAYHKGFTYIDTYFGIDDDPYKLKLEVSEDGVVFGAWEKEPYITPTLNEKFFDGVYAGLDLLPRIDKEVLWQQAYLAGRQNTEGTLGSQFYLDPGFEINGTGIYTDTYDSKIEFELDEETGWLGMRYRPPFKGKYLCAAYKQGVDEAFAELNTPEMMQHRLNTEVVELRRQRQAEAQRLEQERKKQAEQELWATILGIGVVAAPIVAGIAAWYLTSGFTTFLCMLGIVIVVLTIWDNA